MDQFGDFDHVDLNVQFTREISPLLFSPGTLSKFQSSPLPCGEEVDVFWTENGAQAEKIELLVAENTMESVNSFQYPKHVKTLDWISAGVADNTGYTRFIIPCLSPKSAQVQVFF
jgi:hypothetical protein